MKDKKADDTHFVKLLFESNDSKEFNFAYLCKFTREAFRMTQEQMAAKLQVTPSAYRFWEYGKRKPSAEAAANLAVMYLQALNVNNNSFQATRLKLLLDELLLKKSLNITTEFKDLISDLLRDKYPELIGPLEPKTPKPLDL